jgi:hypothetical protein
MRISEQTIKTFETESGLFLFFGFGLATYHYQLSELKRGDGNLESCTSCQILGFDKDTGKYVCIKFNAPKNKEIIPTYLFDKVAKSMNKENTYKNLRRVFEKMLPSYAFYATSYGVGMDALFKSHETVIQAAQGLCDFLDKNGIEYKNEYSDAAWVYRFVISKSRKNIDKINAL